MKFYWDSKIDSYLKDILIELCNQYADDNSNLGITDFNNFVKPNLELLLMCIDELIEIKK
jgi:hypothetical protein